MMASQNGHVEVVDRLIQHGATVDLQDEVRAPHVLQLCKGRMCIYCTCGTNTCMIVA